MNKFLICFFFIISCTADNVSETELKKIINDEKNGLKKMIETNNIKLIATYKPADLVALNEIRAKKILDAKTIEYIRSDYSHTYFFVLSFSIDNKSLITQVDPSIRDQVLNKLNYELKENIFITYRSSSVDIEILPVMDYMYTNTFGTTNADDVLVSFDNKELTQTETFTLNIKDLSVQGQTEKIIFNTDDIKKLPKLKFN